MVRVPGWLAATSLGDAAVFLYKSYRMIIKPRILIYHPDAERYAERLARRLPSANFVATSEPGTFHRELPESDVLLAQHFPPDALAAAPRLRWIQVTSSGTEFLHGREDALAGRILTNGRGVHAEPIADYVMGALVMLQQGMAERFRDQLAKRWRRGPIRTLAGRRVAIVGLGPIGQEVARRAKVFAMSVTGVRRSNRPCPAVDRLLTPDRLPEALGDADFVVLAVPGTTETREMIAAAELAAMKPGAYLVNVSRGSVVDEPALIEALTDGRVAGAALDVFATEPLPQDNPLWTLPSVVVTPHIAGMRTDYEDRLLDIFCDNLERFAQDQPLLNLVDPARGY